MDRVRGNLRAGDPPPRSRKGVQQADADDLAQEVFRTVAGVIEQWDPNPARGSFRAWLSRIARNLIVNLLAARSRQTASFGTGGTEMVEILEAQPARRAQTPPCSTSSIVAGSLPPRPIVPACIFRKPPGRPSGTPASRARTSTAVAAELGLTTRALYVARSRVMARLRHEIDQIEGVTCNE